MRKLKGKLRVLPGMLDKLESLSVGADPDQDSDFIRVFKGWIEMIKAAGIKIADQAIKEAGILNQDTEPLQEIPVLLISNEGQVSGHVFSKTGKRALSYRFMDQLFGFGLPVFRKLI